MKKESNNTKYLDGGKRMNLVKSFGAVSGILVISLILFQGCTSSTGSTSSGSGSIPRVQVISAASSMQTSTATQISDSIIYTWSSTFITVVVRDVNGNPVPAGIPVNIVCGDGYLGDNPDVNNQISFVTINTNSNGQVQVRYSACFCAGTASISATSQGNYGSTTIKITSS
jgi:hypothetical protein